jgi:sugar phosphate isomerase/epimerase
MTEGRAMIFGIKYPYHVERPLSLEEGFELTSHLGFDHVDFGSVFLKNIEVRRSVEFITRFRNVASDHGLSYSFHLSYRAAVLLDNGRFDVDALTRYFFALNIAREVDARFVAMHPLSFGAVKDVDVLSRVYRELAQRAHEVQIPLAVENPVHNVKQYPNTLDEFRVLRKQVDDLYYLLDTGHAYLEGGDPCLDAYVSTLDDRLLGIHVSDNHGDTDEHLPVGDGSIDFPRLLVTLNRHDLDVPLILEIWSQDGFVPSKEAILKIC